MLGRVFTTALTRVVDRVFANVFGRVFANVTHTKDFENGASFLSALTLSAKSNIEGKCSFVLGIWDTWFPCKHIYYGRCLGVLASYTSRQYLSWLKCSIYTSRMNTLRNRYVLQWLRVLCLRTDQTDINDQGCVCFLKCSFSFFGFLTWKFNSYISRLQSMKQN